MSEPIPDRALVDALEKYDRKIRRNFKAAIIRHYRYLTRTPIAQQQADAAAYNRQVLERGWIVPSKEGHDAH